MGIAGGRRVRAVEVTAQEAASLTGLVLCHNVFDPEKPKSVLLRKGRVLTPGDRPHLERLGNLPLHLLELGPDDVGETEAGLRLGSAAAGSNVEVAGESESQVRLVATKRGVLHVDQERLAQVVGLDGILVWTLEAGVPVEEGRHVASAKVAPLAVPRQDVEIAEEKAAGGLVRVVPYRDRAVSVLVREQMDSRARDKFEASIRMKLEWFGASAPTVCYVGAGTDAAARGLQELIHGGAELVLVGGTGSTDPLDPMFLAICSLGGQVLRLGVPAHPGSTYWLADLQGVPVLGLASCGMFSQMTALDLLLPRFFSGEAVTSRMLTSLAVGGLIGRECSYLFPQYEEER